VSELNLQELLDRAALAADARCPEASVTDVEPLHGGISSLSFSGIEHSILAGPPGRLSQADRSPGSRR